MTLAALVDAGVDPQAIQAGIASLPLDGVRLSFHETMRCGFRALKLEIIHPRQRVQRNLSQICGLIDAATELTPRQKLLARDIFTTIGRAEATVHGVPVDQIHFHEVGAIDSIVDIIGVAIGWDLLGVEQTMCSPIPTGRGYVKIEHGVCPIPAPGTAELLKGIPLAEVPIEAELTTPTGAAIVRTLADRFGPLPPLTVHSIGYGAGTKDFPNRANVVRLFVGELQTGHEMDEVVLLETNLDDISAEVIGYTQQQLLSAGAWDVYITPIQMKKNRPGVLFSVLCDPLQCERLEQILFTETGTFGIRRSKLWRTKRQRQTHSVETAWGSVQGKLGWLPGQPALFTPEFESCAAIARARGVALREVYRSAESAYALAPVTNLPGTD